MVNLEKTWRKEEDEQKDREKWKENLNNSALETGKKVGRRFKRVRKDAGMTQEEAAFYIGKKRTVISKLENGNYFGLTLRDFYILSLIYGYYPGDLLNKEICDECDC